MTDPIYIYVDGSCRNNGNYPNIGAWAYLLKYKEYTKESSEIVLNTTNNKTEILSLIEALKAVKNRNLPVIVTTDSQYVCSGLNEWVPNWIKNDWKNSKKKTVENKELWEELWELKNQFIDIIITKCDGHSDNDGNNAVDAACNRIMDIEERKSKGMENSEKVKLFEKELGYIRNPDIRKFTEKAIEGIGDGFFNASASSSGKYHPAYTVGPMGLYKHTVAAVRIAIELLRMGMYRDLSEDEKDLVVTSLILHDTCKSGINFSENFTVHEHPFLVGQALRNNPNLEGIISSDYLETICNNIFSHMGVWTTSKFSSIILPTPKTISENLVHTADYIASRKCLTFEFDIPVERD